MLRFGWGEGSGSTNTPAVFWWFGCGRVTWQPLVACRLAPLQRVPIDGPNEHTEPEKARRQGEGGR
eukprot:6194881-Prymnesium_polylepis.2